MFARLITLETTEEQHEEGLRLTQDELLPWARESTGFRGLIGLVDRAAGKTLVLTLWASEETLRESADAADRLSALGAATTGATRQAIEQYEVTLFEVEA
jgi:hypothetical protein